MLKIIYIYIDFQKEVYDKDPEFKVNDHVRTFKYKNIFAKGYVPNWFEEFYVIKKVKNTVPWTYIINDLNGEKIIGTFYGKKLQKTNQQEFRIEKVIKKKGDKLYVKQKGYDLIRVHLIAVLIKKKLSVILSYKNEPIFSETV